MARVTIAAIAEEAGVSVPTVSRVLNGRADVAPQTRELVEKLLKQHGYRRRTSRQQTGRANLIDLVFNDLDSPWAVELIRGVEDVMHGAGVGTVLSAVHKRSADTRRWLQNLYARRSDGVIFVISSPNTAAYGELQRLNIPVVVVDPAGGAPPDIPVVGATNWSGGMAASQHLTSLGHRRIGFITGSMQMVCSQARLAGFRAALGTLVDESLIVEGDFDYKSGYEGALALLRRPDRPTAIFASSDTMALGVYEAARRTGLRVPEDVSVVGFDDLPEARWTSPPLTTVRQPLADMGALAARTVLRLAAGGEIETPRLELATDLVVRDSTASVS